MRLLLIEDDELVSRELLLRWQSRKWVVTACNGLAQADAALVHGPYALLVLDLGLPDGDGLSWLGRLRQRDRLTPVLVLTARDRVNDRVLGLRTGADDYLVKPFSVEELDARVEALTRRGDLRRGGVVQFGGITWIGDEAKALAHDVALELSPREFEVLGLLMQRAPHLVHKRALVDALAERNLEVGDSTAELYVSRLRRKLTSTGTAILTVRGFGYRLVLDDTEPGPEA